MVISLLYTGILFVFCWHFNFTMSLYKGAICYVQHFFTTMRIETGICITNNPIISSMYLINGISPNSALECFAKLLCYKTERKLFFRWYKQPLKFDLQCTYHKSSALYQWYGPICDLAFFSCHLWPLHICNAPKMKVSEIREIKVPQIQIYLQKCAGDTFSFYASEYFHYNIKEIMAI